MRNAPLHSTRPAVHLKKISDFLLTGLLFSLVILTLCFLFHKGAGLAAKIVDGPIQF